MNVDLNDINDQLINDLEAVSKEFHGKMPLKVNVLDKEKNLNVEMLSRKFNIDPSNEFLEKVGRIAEVECSLLEVFAH